MAQSRTPFPHLPSRSLPGDDSRRDTVIGVLDRVLARDDRPTPTTLVLVRGFDRASRSMVPTARRVAAASMLSFHDAVPAAAFGCVPEIDGMAVVLVANSALIPIAERYAAEWAGWVLALGDAVEEPVLRPAPAVLITAADGRRDHAVARLCVPGVAEPARDGRFDLAVEPTRTACASTATATARTSRPSSHPRGSRWAGRRWAISTACRSRSPRASTRW